MQRRTFLGRMLVGAAAVTAAPVMAAGRRAGSSPGTRNVPALPRHGRILFQGDSITDGGRWKHSDDPNHIYGQSYAYLLAARCGGHFPQMRWSFFNRGVSGNTVKDLAARWQTDTLDLKPDVLSILVGANDTIGQFDPSLKTASSVEEYADVYDRLLTRTVRALPGVKLVLCEPFTLPGPRNQGKWQAFSHDVAARGAVVRRLAARHGAVFVELQRVFDAARKQAPAGYWIWDGVHPTYAGHELLADQWLRSVDAAHAA